MLNDYEIRRYDKLLATLKLIISAIALYIVVQIVPSFIELLEENRPSYSDDLMVRVIANSNTAKDQQIKQQIALDIDKLMNNSSTEVGQKLRSKSITEKPLRLLNHPGTRFTAFIKSTMNKRVNLLTCYSHY